MEQDMTTETITVSQFVLRPHILYNDDAPIVTA